MRRLLSADGFPVKKKRRSGGPFGSIHLQRVPMALEGGNPDVIRFRDPFWVEKKGPEFRFLWLSPPFFPLVGPKRTETPKKKQMLFVVFWYSTGGFHQNPKEPRKLVQVIHFRSPRSGTRGSQRLGTPFSHFCWWLSGWNPNPLNCYFFFLFFLDFLLP